MSNKKNDSECDNEDIISDFKSLRLSALTNAARISPFVSGVTIGPNSIFQSADLITVTIQNEFAQPIKPVVEKTKVRITINANENSRKVEIVSSPKNKLDLATINQKAIILSAEKQRKDKVKKEISERNVKLKEDNKRIQSRIQAAHLESQKRIQQKEQMNAKLLQDHYNIQDLADREFAENQKQQLIQQRKRVSDVSSEIKKREESIKQRDLAIEGFRGTQSLFKDQMDLFTKNYQGLREEQKPHFANSKKMVLALMKNIEIIAQKVFSSNTISKSDLELADKLLADIKKVNVEVLALCKVQEQQLIEAQEKERAKEQDAQTKLLQLKQAQDAVDSKAKQDAANTQVLIKAGQGNVVNNADLVRYNKLMEVFEKYSLNEQQLGKLPNLGSYKMRLMKAINMPCNAISAKDPQFLLDKFERLSSLLSGNSVQAGSDETVSTNEHPCGKDFVFVYLGKKFVNLGDTVISSHTQAAYSIAAVLVALWQRFPELGQLFLAQLYKECPYLLPIFLPQREGQSDREYYSSLGCRYDDQGVREDLSVYMKRITGFTRLYAAIVVTQTRRGETKVHPQGLKEAWNFMASFMNLEPLPDISALIIFEFLQVAGDLLQQTFGQQFKKMILAIHEQYIPKLDGSGSHKSRLEAFIVKFLNDGKFEEAGEALPPNFW